MSDVRRPRVAHLATTDLTHRFLLLPQLERLAADGWDVSAISADGPWVGELEQAGIRHIAWKHAVRSWDPLADAKAFTELLAILGRERFDVLHCHNPKPGVLGRIAGRMAGVPVVLNTVHGFYATPEDPPARRVPVLSAELLAARCSSFELYQSREDLGWARELGIARRGRSRLLGNGVDLSRFGPLAVSGERRSALRTELGVGEDEVLVGTIGRMVAEKGYRELFAAAAEVRAARPWVRFLAVGAPDEDKADALSLEEIERAANDVIVTGWRTDVPDLLAAMDVFVLASWREGLPRAAVEAAATGLPLILTDIRGCREVVGDGEAGILIQPRSVAEIARAVGALAEDEERRAALGRLALERARSSFDEEKVLDIVAGLTRVLAGGPSRAGVGDGTLLRGSRERDVAQIADLHARTMPNAFLTSLGQGFLRRFHRGLIAFPESAAYVLEVDGELAGFVAGVPSMRRFLRWFVLHHGAQAAASTLSRPLRPAGARGVIESIRYAGGDRSEDRSVPDAELIAIAVDPAHRGRGVGLRLGETLLDALSIRGCDEVKVVVGKEYAVAFGLYRRLGFAPHADVGIHEDRPSRVLVARGLLERELPGFLRRTQDDGDVHPT